MREDIAKTRIALTGSVGGQVLQALIWPDPQVHPDPRLTFRLGAGVTVPSPGIVQFEPDGVLGLNTAYNLFSWVKWHRECGIRNLILTLHGTGRFAVEVAAEQTYDRTTLRLDLTLVEDKPCPVDLTDWLGDRHESVVSVTLRAMSPGTISAVNWVTPQPAKRQPKMLLSVTTFRREKAATATALRIDAALQGHPLSEALHLLVVDNGNTLTLPPLSHVTLVRNRNLGGAGGFARGLAEAMARGYTYCLFMDDDAWVDLASIVRTWVFLANVTDPAVAISGTLTRADEPTVVWEHAAVFDGGCRRLFADLHLLDADDLAEVELSSGRDLLRNVYGAFWYFAFPVSAVRHWPFPSFVRGDDVNFSIVNPFRVLTLPGVISYQADDFADKDTSMSQYLSLRGDLLQLVLLDHMPKRFRSALRAPCVFFMRMLIMQRMDSLHALNLAVEDILTGPDYFAANPDLAARRAELSALRLREIWTPVTKALPALQQSVDPEAGWQRLLMKLSMNGFLLPFFGRWGNRIHLPRNDRRLVRNCWGAAQITFLSPDGMQAMTVRHDKAIILREGFRMTWNLLRMAFGFRRLRKTWLTGFPNLTSEEFWQSKFRDPE